MGKQKPLKPIIPGFTPLTPSIHLHDNTLTPTTTRPALTFTPSTSPLPLPHPSPSTSSPDLIILASWTGALPRHVAKYTLSYQTLYPSTPILLLTTSITDLALSSTASKITALLPACSYLLPSPTHPGKRSILLHAFSEGGAHKSVLLAHAYLLATSNASRIPIRAFIFDSTPGTPRYASNVAAFKRSLPRNPAARALGIPVGGAVVGVHWVFFTVFAGLENNVISKTRKALNDEALWDDLKGAARTYIFGEEDDLIFWEDVERHGRESAEGGIRSLMVRFRRTGHCGHARGNEGLYWGIVRRTWEGSKGKRDEGGKEVLSCVCCGEEM
ncbi:hypothetical protein OQA88_8051 [Cercophora sp. LCS_1]